MADSNFNVGIIFKASDQASSVIKSVGKSFTGLNDKLKNISAEAKRLSIVLGASITAPLAAVGYKALQETIQFDNLRTSLNLFTKDAAKTKKVLDDIDKLKMEIPIDEDQIDAAALSLAKFRVPIDNISSSIQLFSKLSLASGVALEEIISMFASTQTKGFADLKAIVGMGKAGIPIMDFLTEKLGKSRREIIMLARQGKITAGVFTGALKQMTSEGGIFSNVISEKMQLIDKQFVLTGNILSQSLQDIGDAIKESFGIENLVAFNEGLRKVGTWLRAFIAEHPKLTKFTIAFLALAAIIAPITAALAAITFALSLVSGPILAITAAVAGLNTAIALFITYKKELTDMWKILKNFGIVGLIQSSLVNIDALKKKEFTAGSPTSNVPIPYRNEKSTSDVNIMISLPEGVNAKVGNKKSDPRTSVNVGIESYLGQFFPAPIPYRR